MQRISKPPHVVVLGLMGVGKSTTASALAEATDLPCFDSDHDIVAVFGQTGRDVAATVGIASLHMIESAMLVGRLAARNPSVISAAASVVEDPHCRKMLGLRATTVVLTLSMDELERRMATGVHRRAIPRGELEVLAARRAPLFAEVADLTLDARESTTDLVAQVAQHLSLTERGV